MGFARTSLGPVSPTPKHQVAWECRHIDAAESFPYGVSNMELKSDRVCERMRLKALVPEEFGPKALARERSDEAYAAHENWKRIVERVSTAALTNSEDKLITLAGIAELMAGRIGENVIYVAGMREKYLENQLLWHVKPKYEDERFEYSQAHPDKWRAPMFSWAVVDATQGIECVPTIREEDLQIEVEKIHVTPSDSSEPGEARFDNRRFGLIADDCYIDVRCSLSKINIEKILSPPNEKIVDDDVERTVKYV